MCGIVGYVGKKRAAPILLGMLSRLEYRGYDSAGLATLSDSLHVEKDRGGVSDLDPSLPGTLGLGHTRWATHGRPSKANAHPHLNSEDTIAVVHNGIIENYRELKNKLKIDFRSQTDTEVLAHLISESYEGDLLEAVRRALLKVEGSFGIGVIAEGSPGEIVVARRHSPVVVGIGDNETFLASDVPAFLSHTNKALFLEDDEIGRVTADGAELFSLSGSPVSREPVKIEWSAEQAEKGGYDHFMLKEIHEQPKTISETLRGLTPSVDFGDDLYILACGTSYHAGMIALPFLAGQGIKARLVISSEFSPFASLLDEHSTVLAISQSGETADTLSAVEMAETRGARVIALTNVVGSSLARLADEVIYTRCGPEIGVASTKTFTAQVAALTALTRGLSIDEKQFEEFVANVESQTEKAAEMVRDADHLFFIGREQGYGLSLEGALKLKEIGYIHAEGFAGGELKHGPLALVEDGTWVVAIGGFKPFKMMSNVMEVKARGAKIISICPEGDERFRELSEATIEVPYHLGSAAPIHYALPLQLLAYKVGVSKGIDVDKPRNLAKSVTVE